MELVEKLAAIEDIRVLKARYWRCVDDRRWDDWRNVFMPDIQFQFPEFERPSSLDEFIAWTAAFLEGSVSIHRGYCPEIEITGDATAQGIWGFEDRIYWSSDKPGSAGLAALQGDGHYHETYARLGGGWRIASLRVVRQRLTTTAHQLSLSVDKR